MSRHGSSITFTQPNGAAAPDVLGVLPRRVAWTNKKADGKWRVLLQMPYPEASEGACYGMQDPPHLIDVPTKEQVQEAKDMCGECPIRRQCAAWGIAHEEHYIFGGLTASERKDIRNRLNVQMFDPVRGHVNGMNENPFPTRGLVCKNGHALDERDMERSANLVDDPYRHTYQLKCSTCWYERTQSEEAR